MWARDDAEIRAWTRNQGKSKLRNRRGTGEVSRLGNFVIVDGEEVGTWGTTREAKTITHN